MTAAAHAPQLAIGGLTLAAGIALLVLARVAGPEAPRWQNRTGAGVALLGLGTLVRTLPGVSWSLASSATSVTAIVLFVLVLRDMLRRR